MLKAIRTWLGRLFPPTTINNYFTISSNLDPSRIARDVASHIADSRRFPGQSPDVPDVPPGGRRRD